MSFGLSSGAMVGIVGIACGVAGGLAAAYWWCCRRGRSVLAHFRALCRPDVYTTSAGEPSEFLPALPAGGIWHEISSMVRESHCALARLVAQGQQGRAALEVRLRRAAGQLRQAQMLLDLLPYPIVLFAGLQDVVYANRAARNIFGSCPQNGDSAEEAPLTLPESLQSLVESVCRRSGPPRRSEELELPGHDGQLIRYRCRAVKLRVNELLADKEVPDSARPSCHLQAAAEENFRPEPTGGNTPGGVLSTNTNGAWDDQAMLTRGNGRQGRQVRTAGFFQEEPPAVALILEPQSDLQALRAQEAAFLSAVAHEMKTPLASIRAYAELLADEDADDPHTREEFLGVINTQVDRLQRLVQNLLDLARIEAGILRVNKSTISLNEILEQAAEVVRPAAEAKSLAFVVELSPLFLPVHVDRDLMLQVAINLLSNAVKYTPAGGRVTLRSRLDDCHAVFQVEDTGVGLSEEECQRIFDRFYRVKRIEQMAEGTGLGLALVKSIVEDLHGGQITVESALGRGTTFTVRLGTQQAVAVK